MTNSYSILYAQTNNMSETKRIGYIEYIVDTEYGYEQIGDIEMGVGYEELVAYVERHGHERILMALTHLQHRIWTIRDNQKVDEIAVATNQPVPKGD